MTSLPLLLFRGGNDTAVGVALIVFTLMLLRTSKDMFKTLKDTIALRYQAQKQAEKVIEQARTTIQFEKQAAISDIKNQVAEISIGIAEKVVRGELSDKDKQTKLVEEMLKEVTIS